jgi:hypothetical protein
LTHQRASKSQKESRYITTFPTASLLMSKRMQDPAISPLSGSTQRLPPPDIATGLLSTLSFTAGWRTNNADLQSSVVVPTKNRAPEPWNSVELFFRNPGQGYSPNDRVGYTADSARAHRAWDSVRKPMSYWSGRFQCLVSRVGSRGRRNTSESFDPTALPLKNRLQSMQT